MTDNTFAPDTLPHRMMRRYLLDHGWQVSSNSKRSIELFSLRGQDGEPDIEIVLPASQDSRAWISSVRDALTTLSQLESRQIGDIVRDVRSIASDVFHSIVPDQYVWQDSIDLQIAREFTKGFRQFLASAATTEQKPSPFFARITKEALEYANGCRFGHTFRGSFGFRVESPVGLNDQPTMDGVPPQSPFARRVVERIARGFQATNEAATAEDPSVLTDRYDTGMSANMCDELIELAQRTGVVGLGISISFSPEWRPSINQTGTRLLVEPRHMAVLEHASVELRKKEGPKEVAVFGRVRSLQTDANPSDLLEGPTREVDVVWDSDEYGMIRVHILLEPVDYLEAVEAHKNGQLVRAIGLLERTGRRWFLKRPRDFRRVEL